MWRLTGVRVRDHQHGPRFTLAPEVEARMSWAITVNDLDTVSELPDDIYANAAKDNPAYDMDARAAFFLAKSLGLVSCTISGGRTPSMYGGPDTIVVSVVGFNNRNEAHAVPPVQARDFNAAVLDEIFSGPGTESDDDDEYPGFWHAPYEGDGTTPPA